MTELYEKAIAAVAKKLQPMFSEEMSANLAAELIAEYLSALPEQEPIATVAEIGAAGHRWLVPHPPGSADHLPIGTKLFASPLQPDPKFSNPNSDDFKNECWLDFKLGSGPLGEGQALPTDVSHRDTFKGGFDRGFFEAVKLQIAKEKSALQPDREIIARFIAEGWASAPTSGNLTVDDYLGFGGAHNQADELIKRLSRAGSGDAVRVPIPRGGVEPNWWEEWVKTTRAYNALAKAAQAVIDETAKIHDTEPPPVKYRAPYGSITKLIEVLAKTDRASIISSADAGPWCQPRYEGKDHPRKFMVVYEDADMGNAVFDDEAEAREHFEKASINWNCYLFGLMPRSALVTSDRTEDVRDETFTRDQVEAHVNKRLEEFAIAQQCVSASKDELIRELVRELSRIADDYHPAYDDDAPLALSEMREAVSGLVTLASEAGYNDGGEK